MLQDRGMKDEIEDCRRPRMRKQDRGRVEKRCRDHVKKIADLWWMRSAQDLDIGRYMAEKQKE